MQDEKLKTSVRLPISMIESVRQAGYASTTEAIIAGLELLLSKAYCETMEDTSSTERYTALESENGILKEYNDTLKKELENVRQDKKTLQTTHDNYMLQVQSLINQKAIESPGEKKRWWKRKLW